jgi:alcohol dehydrogenase, propanol-preferring
MKAVALVEAGKMEVIDMADPLGDEGVVVAVKAAGVCGTELHILDGMIPAPFFPFVLGHEGAGVVVSAPQGSSVEKGDRVAIYNLWYCGECKWCRSGREEVCSNPVGQMGFNMNGTFRDLVQVPSRNLVPLPSNVSFQEAALLSCSGMTAIHAIRLAKVSVGDIAVVNGIGGVGLMVIQACVAAGATVIGIADTESRAALSREAGASNAIVLDESGYEVVADRIRDLTGGEGAQHFFELVGTSASINAGIRGLAKHGAVVLIGYTGENINIHPIELILSEARILSSVAATQSDLVTAIELASQGKMRSTIDTCYSLSDAGVALDRLRARQVMGRNLLVWD